MIPLSVPVVPEEQKPIAVEITTLEGVLARLYQAFNAVSRYSETINGEASRQTHIAIGTIGQALVAAEVELRERNAVKQHSLPGKSLKNQ